MFSFTQYLISQGLSQEIIILLLMLPICATIIAIARQVIGIKGFGIYTPLIIAFAFLEIGIQYGLILFVFIILLSTLMRLSIKRFRLLYLPRMSIILTGVATFTLFFLVLNNYIHYSIPSFVSVFAILIMIALSEKFITAQIERGARESMVLSSETLLLAVICYFVASLSWLENIVLNFPLLVIAITILINIFIGKWTGLRISEYFRFREVTKRMEVPKKK